MRVGGCFGAHTVARASTRIDAAQPGDASLAYASRAVTSAARSSSSRFARSRLPHHAVVSARRRRRRERRARGRARSASHAALVTFSRSAGGAPELGLVENGEWLWTVSGEAYPRGMIDLVRALHDANLTPAEILERERAATPFPLLRHPARPHPRAAQRGAWARTTSSTSARWTPTSPASAGGGALRPHHLHQGAPSVVGHRGGIIFPTGVTEEVDYEGELGVVIGRAGKAISKEDALDHVFGYRRQRRHRARRAKRHQQWYLGKSFDTFCPMGPWIVPKRGIRDPQALEIGTTVNGERDRERHEQDDLDIRELVAVASRCMTPSRGRRRHRNAGGGRRGDGPEGMVAGGGHVR